MSKIIDVYITVRFINNVEAMLFTKNRFEFA